MLSHFFRFISRFCFYLYNNHVDYDINAGDDSILPVTIRFITTQGRMKFVRPLYRVLFQSNMGKELAKQIFLEHHTFYHPIAAKMIASDLSVSIPFTLPQKQDADGKDEDCDSTSRIRKNDKLEVKIEAKGDYSKGSAKAVYVGIGLSFLAAVGFIFLRRKK